jgi:hypothetical protein
MDVNLLLSERREFKAHARHLGLLQLYSRPLADNSDRFISLLLPFFYPLFPSLASVVSFHVGIIGLTPKMYHLCLSFYDFTFFAKLPLSRTLLLLLLL